MLKLEKTQQEITLTIRTQERRVNRTFLSALTIALALHAGALLLFQIYQFLPRDTLLPPTTVEALFEEETFAQAGLEELMRKHFLQPTPSMPSLSTFLLPTQNCLELQVEKQTQDPFLALKEDWEALFHPQKDESMTTPVMQITGLLAERELLGSVTELLAKHLPPVSGTYTYDVRMENQSGKIFWFSPVHPQDPQLEREMRKLLLALRFKPDPQECITSGQIEIIMAKS